MNNAEIFLRRHHYIYLIDESDNIEFYPFCEFARLREKETCLPTFKNCLVRYIAASVLIKDQIPFEIERITYCNLKFDGDGRVEWDGHGEASALVKKYQNVNNKVHDINENFKTKTEKEFFEILHKKNQWFWEPSEHIKEAIVEDIFS